MGYERAIGEGKGQSVGMFPGCKVGKEKLEGVLEGRHAIFVIDASSHQRDHQAIKAKLKMFIFWIYTFENAR